ncbi:hypothetical protein F4801DRAFT_3016 [Xylaria longipes]|nr:hypothetical protein F4801DRAFT_3016 [Xylaria longipes]
MAGWSGPLRIVYPVYPRDGRTFKLLSSLLYLAHRQSRSLPFPLQIASGLLLLLLHGIHMAASQPLSQRIAPSHLHRPPIAPEPILWNQSPTACQSTQPITSYPSYPLHLIVDLIACCPTTLINAIIGEYPRLGYPNLTYSRPISLPNSALCTRLTTTRFIYCPFDCDPGQHRRGAVASRATYLQSGNKHDNRNKTLPLSPIVHFKPSTTP